MRLLNCSIAALTISAAIAASPFPAVADDVIYANQGKSWSETRRNEFYFTDQGSRIMALSWMRALKTADGAGFMDDALGRYGYLPDSDAPASDVPVGFTVAKTVNGATIGMTCAACHTRQIEVQGAAIRIDGGPAMVDFQGLLSDLDVAMRTVLGDEVAFKAFADAVLGADAGATARATLKVEADLWSLRFHTLIDRSLPDPAWGPGRLDAVSMIFNRLTGLDLGKPPSLLIPENVHRADAPTRYPFLWNAARQDKTQWPGFADNGNELLGLARNLGEVYGVFGEFQPVEKDSIFGLDRNYIVNNSANFDGLKDLEDLIWKIGPPAWQWKTDPDKVAAGKAIFDRKPDAGGCKDCHGIRTGATRSLFHRTWLTPVQDVGTDRRECEILDRMAVSGVLEGAKIPFGDKLGAEAKAFDLLSTSVIGAIVQNAVGYRSTASGAALEGIQDVLPREFDDLQGAFARPKDSTLEGADDDACKYEARVLEGIWAAAPYLHNGSVPTLEDLLKPAAERTKSFKLGPNYDINAVGLATEQTRFDYTLQTTGCDDLSSGNSNCGHEYGTGISDKERAELLEYLKTL
jgi:mono/diheme cytochrome c family protein